MSRAATAKIVVGDDYLDLIKEFPLRPIRLARDHAAAQVILDRLIGRDDLTVGQRDYLEGLVRFVAEYEREHHLGRLRPVTPLEMLRHLMEENHMSRSDLGQIIGSRGLASEILNGKRGLSKSVIRKLAARFRVNPGVFLGSDDRTART